MPQFCGKDLQNYKLGNIFCLGDEVKNVTPLFNGYDMNPIFDF
jgi:hypothetical protein